jgi:hypothetical protein
LLFDAILAVCKQQGWLKERQRQRTDSTHVRAESACDQSTAVRRRSHALCAQ